MNKKQLRVVIAPITTPDEMETLLNQCGEEYYLRALSFQTIGIVAIFAPRAEPKTKASE
jgi:hypothetical protein